MKIVEMSNGNGIVAASRRRQVPAGKTIPVKVADLRRMGNLMTTARQLVTNKSNKVVAATKPVTKTDVFGDLCKIFGELIGNQAFVVSVLVVAIIIFSHYEGLEFGPFGKWIKDNPKSVFLNWFKESYKMVFNFLIYLPAFYGVPRPYRNYVVLGSVLIVLLLDIVDYYQNLLICVCTIVYMRTKRPNTKYLMILLFCGLVYFQHIKLGKFVPGQYEYTMTRSKVPTTPPPAGAG